jgi:hypothetical protein
LKQTAHLSAPCHCYLSRCRAPTDKFLKLRLASAASKTMNWGKRRRFEGMKMFYDVMTQDNSLKDELIKPFDAWDNNWRYHNRIMTKCKKSVHVRSGVVAMLNKLL